MPETISPEEMRAIREEEMASAEKELPGARKEAKALYRYQQQKRQEGRLPTRRDLRHELQEALRELKSAGYVLSKSGPDFEKLKGKKVADPYWRTSYESAIQTTKDMIKKGGTPEEMQRLLNKLNSANQEIKDLDQAQRIRDKIVQIQEELATGFKPKTLEAIDILHGRAIDEDVEKTAQRTKK